jgi:pimeloyl-ACP methyl ester carboxylesterase
MKSKPITGLTLAAALLLVSLEACVSTPRTTFARGENYSECVVLLHGLNRSWRAMQPMAEALREDGFSTANVDYPSQAGGVEVLAPLAVDTGLQECRRAGATRIHFVTHSIGGILLRYSHKQSPIPDLGRVVMLAPPNHGSEIVDLTKDWPASELFAGEAGLQLGTDEQSIPAQLGPVDFELGVMAMLPDPDDGKVSVASTRIEGMTDFVIVENSHRYITSSDAVIENTKSFLRTGAFANSKKQAGLL